MSLLINYNYARDLNAPLTVERLAGVLSSNDAKAHQFAVTVNGESLTGANVYGYFVNAANQTVVLAGSVVNNAAVVVLTNACYSVAGAFQFVIRATVGELTTTLLIVSGVVHTTQTQTLVDDSNVIPSITELLAKIAACEEAARRAEQFSERAPYINPSNLHWMVFNTAVDDYVDTGVVAKGEKGDRGEKGADGTGAGTITGVSVDGVSVSTAGVANITTVAVTEGARGIPSADGVYVAINAAVGNVESALASL